MIAEIKFSRSKFYDVIINYSYPKEDYISALLISDYKAYILSLTDFRKANKYDLAMKEYISNNLFNKFIHDNESELLSFIEDTRFYLLNKYSDFLLLQKRNKNIWI